MLFANNDLGGLSRYRIALVHKLGQGEWGQPALLEVKHGGAVSVLEWRAGGFRPVLYAHFLNLYFFKFQVLAPLFYI